MLQAGSIAASRSLATRLFMGTIDGHLVAVDATSGRPVWDVAIAKPEAGYSVTVAPLVVKDKVIVGTAGGAWHSRDSSRRTTPRPERKIGASTRSPALASQATTRGVAIPGRPVAAPSGSPALYDPI